MNQYKKILVLPHIGTAFGHLVRTAEFLSDFSNQSNAKIYIVIPEKVVDFAKVHIPDGLQIITRQQQVTVNNSIGKLLIDDFKKYFDEDEVLFQKITPDLIISDPGIQGAILWYKYKKPWIGLVHGGYLPAPQIENEELSYLAQKTWQTINKSLDRLIQIGTNDKYQTWAELRSSGFLIIPNMQQNEPVIIEAGHINKKLDKIGWENKSEVELLITCCSSGEIEPTEKFLRKLQLYYFNIAVAGLNKKGIINGINYLGNTVNFESLVGKDTTVITHGGHGTLKAVSNAKRIITIPSDLDQLCNSIISHINKNTELVFDKNWLEVLEHNPYRRVINWDNIEISKNKNEIVFSGVSNCRFCSELFLTTKVTKFYTRDTK
ncbi:MAG: hypothetical protein LBS55_11185 [Prevotellaceae bacterium]|jgi:hypothetical protein|nr:hypothetical protein [Prevotellaceae bacterium]